jgi:hypothetical protein
MVVDLLMDALRAARDVIILWDISTCARRRISTLLFREPRSTSRKSSHPLISHFNPYVASNLKYPKRRHSVNQDEGLLGILARLSSTWM